MSGVTVIIKLNVERSYFVQLCLLTSGTSMGCSKSFKTQTPTLLLFAVHDICLNNMLSELNCDYYECNMSIYHITYGPGVQ